MTASPPGEQAAGGEHARRARQAAARREQGAAAQRLDDGQGKWCGSYVRGGMGEGSWARGRRGSRAVEEDMDAGKTWARCVRR
jgi:hypothetical protein